MNHAHKLETRECYFKELNKKGTITWCIEENCNYTIKKVKE